jgi:phosphatidate phosphatase PAH1
MKIDNIKEQVTHDMENLRKNNETEIQNTMEVQSSRLEQAEDEMEIKGKSEELLIKQFKTCERNMKELTNSLKRPSLRIMGIEEGEEVQAKGICNIFNKITTEIFQIYRKLCSFRYRKPPGHQTDLTKIELPHDTLSLEQ